MNLSEQKLTLQCIVHTIHTQFYSNSPIYLDISCSYVMFLELRSKNVPRAYNSTIKQGFYLFRNINYYDTAIKHNRSLYRLKKCLKIQLYDVFLLSTQYNSLSKILTIKMLHQTFRYNLHKRNILEACHNGILSHRFKCFDIESFLLWLYYKYISMKLLVEI